jgi:chemotaxis receptor (MCP) glutamine deamidase CheD
MNELATIFENDYKHLDRVYVKMNEMKIVPQDKVLHVDLGSCVSVVLAGKTDDDSIWIGANHMFKSRKEDTDVSLQQIGTLYGMLVDQQCEDIKCVGLFGGGYREKSLAKNVAILNIRTVLETLSIFNFNIELFQTGFSQSFSILYAENRNSILVKHREFKTNTIQFFEVTLDKLFI